MFGSFEVRYLKDIKEKGACQCIALDQMIWESQRSGRPPDGQAYIDAVQRRATRRAGDRLASGDDAEIYWFFGYSI
jgi:hypothetical protein